MAELPYMPVPIADAIADAEGLTNEQLGALERVRRVLWRRIEPDAVAPTLTLAEVRAVSRLRGRWAKAGPGLMSRLTVIEGRVSCPFLNAVLTMARKRRAQRVAAGQASAANRTSEAPRIGTSVGTRKARKPLKYNGLDPDLVGRPLKRATSNHNHNSESTPSFSAAANTLELAGTAIVRRCMEVPAPTARRHIAHWSAALNDDARLLELLEAHEAARHRGATYLRMVTEAVNRVTSTRMKGGIQLEAPLRPVVVKAGGRK
jgi:hypothetical protein